MSAGREPGRLTFGREPGRLTFEQELGRSTFGQVPDRLTFGQVPDRLPLSGSRRRFQPAVPVWCRDRPAARRPQRSLQGL